MTRRTRSTIHMLCVRAGLARQDISEEAQKLLEVYEDPNVAPEQREIAKHELDKAIQKIEERVTTRRLKEARDRRSSPPPAPAT